jgi:hypothetical protein
VYRNAWTGLTEPRVVHRTLEMLADLGWIRAEPARALDGGRPTVRFHQSDGSPATTQRTGPATNCQNCQTRHPAIVTTRWLNEWTRTGRLTLR